MFGFGPSSKDRGAFQNPTWDEGFSFFGMKKGFKSFAHGLGMEGSKTCDEEFKRLMEEAGVQNFAQRLGVRVSKSLG